MQLQNLPQNHLPDLEQARELVRRGDYEMLSMLYDSVPNVLSELIRTAFFKLGVGQLQWNVVTAEDMQRAQDDPEHYGNLQVRVAGYSQMFKLIERNLQNHLIARHKHES